MEPIEIIDLQPSQWQEYKDLRLKALIEEPQAYSSSYERSSKEPNEKWKKRLEEALKGESQWLVFARQNEKLVGMVGAFLIEEGVVEVISTYVAKEVRNQGISKQLMNTLLAKIKQNKSIKKILVEVNATQIPALNLYLQYRFTIVGTRKMQLGDKKEYDIHTMEQVLLIDDQEDSNILSFTKSTISLGAPKLRFPFHKNGV